MAYSHDRAYQHLANVPRSLTEVELMEYIPQLTPEDVERGYVERYFVRPVNHQMGWITEVSPHDYENLRSNRMYHTISLRWRISGPLNDDVTPYSPGTTIRAVTGVISANRFAIQEAEKEMPGIINRIRNLTQFHHQ